ncbi:segregation/condensation protein A [uncultured Limosilactobacillus sp.]|uniref:segregation and condensation protein A n=1 Tax=uncultured Limosilactobacillus sp. TaxID=2837629 RepID=UPI0025E32C90|nr:segregation/condensation protein A [uncultured Limosilactobacillus sp.]
MSDKPVIVDHPFQPTIKLEDFEGPLDLLLHLIRQNEMDIRDIQMALITSQYMDYLASMKKHRLEVAGDYFVMAATLMRIKSEMLLPAPPVEEEPEMEPEDPRQELVEQLLEYQRYKDAAAKLKDKEEFRQQEFSRAAMAVPEQMISAKVAPGVSLNQLQTAFEKVVRRHSLSQPVEETVSPEKVTVEERLQAVTHQLQAGPQRFIDLFEDDVSRENLVTTFMALLELCKHGRVLVSQASPLAPLIVRLRPRKGARDGRAK